MTYHVILILILSIYHSIYMYILLFIHTQCDLDAGFKPGRQYGRGASGGQVRDERRQSYDLGRRGDSNSGTTLTPSSLGKRGRIVEIVNTE